MLKTYILNLIKKEFGHEAFKLFKDNDDEDTIKIILKALVNNKLKSKYISIKQAATCLRLIKYLEKNGVLDKDTLKMINGIDYKEFE